MPALTCGLAWWALATLSGCASSSSTPERNGPCPRGTVHVEAPSFSVCMDFYEFPNGVRRTPDTSMTWAEANAACNDRGKRLCTVDELSWACAGPANSRFPYGDELRDGVCNTATDETPNPARPVLEHKKCKSKQFVWNLAGNVEEWAADAETPSGMRVAFGGSSALPPESSTCSSVREVNPTTRSSHIGFRCCVDPLPVKK